MHARKLPTVDSSKNAARSSRNDSGPPNHPIHAPEEHPRLLTLKPPMLPRPVQQHNNITLHSWPGILIAAAPGCANLQIRCAMLLAAEYLTAVMSRSTCRAAAAATQQCCAVKLYAVSGATRQRGCPTAPELQSAC